MAEVDDPGALLFSIDMGNCTKEEYKKMGRSIQWRNSTKLIFYSIAAIIVIVVFSYVITPLIAILALALVIEMLAYFEFSARNIANKISQKVPIHYEFFEDGLTESAMDIESHLTWYNEILRIKKNDTIYTLICKSQVYVIPCNLLDEKSLALVEKLHQQILSRNKNHSLKHLMKKA